MPIKLLFTYALTGGIWAEYASGKRSWISTLSGEFRSFPNCAVQSAVHNPGIWVKCIG